jgi:hypothetical protein
MIGSISTYVLMEKLLTPMAFTFPVLRSSSIWAQTWLTVMSKSSIFSSGKASVGKEYLSESGGY